jgi:nicotinamide mononucleotide transporter
MNEIAIFGQPTSVAEIAAMVTGLAGVYLTVRQSVWCFPAGIINVTLYAIIFFSPGIQLYADALLQCIYILLLIYGWYKWSSVKETAKASVPVSMNSVLILKVTTVILCSTILLALFFDHMTSASYPWVDSALTCASLAAQWMIAKKYIENWIVWIIVDIFYIPLYLVKNLPLTAFLYAVFLVMAVKGFAEWRSAMKYAREN